MKDPTRWRGGSVRYGTVAFPAPVNGFGFIEPDDGGGQLLVRLDNVEAARQLRVGDAVVYTLAVGSFCNEAIAVRFVEVGEQVRR